MHIVAISDTHGGHNNIVLPECDILIHSGDYGNSKNNSKKEFIDFVCWFEKQPAKYKIFISGNHDYFTQDNKEEALRFLKEKDIIYLEDTSVVIEGFKIHGSPWCPNFYNWAYMKEEGDLYNIFSKTIDRDIDILITHTPPHKILDKTLYGVNAGSKALKEVSKELKNLKLHIFGHIHESSGKIQIGQTIFCNAASLGRRHFTLEKTPYKSIDL